MYVESLEAWRGGASAPLAPPLDLPLHVVTTSSMTTDKLN